jgi:plasmid stability protein
VYNASVERIAGADMAELTVSKLNEAAKRRLEARAARNGRSVEVEACAIIEEATAGEASRGDPTDNLSLGDFMQTTFKDIALTDEEWQRFNVGVSEMNAESAFPNFEADEYEESNSDK